MTTALFIGRFQPLHKGHLADIKAALKEYDDLIIAVGSSQYSHIPENPFSFEERVRMIEDTLIAKDLGNYTIYPVPDINDDKKWVNHVKDLVPSFDVVYTGNPKTERLFKAASIKVRKVDMVPGINSTTVRKHMLEDKDWKSLVPNQVVDYVEELKGHHRVKEIHKK
jgi:nicotinamide-nucleotide adenylyltransferase